MRGLRCKKWNEMRRPSLSSLSPRHGDRSNPAPDSRCGRRAIIAFVGSWPFIVTQGILSIFWGVIIVFAWRQHWDPYPFILLNLLLSIEMAFLAPFVIMGEARRSEFLQKPAEHDADVGRKTILEIELLHRRVDQMRESEIVKLTEALDRLSLVLLETPKKAPGPDADRL